MSVLSNNKHEHFSQLLAKGVSAADAYVSAGYSKIGAKVSASRLRAHANIRARVSELQEALAVGTIELEISSRNARIQALQDRWTTLRAGIALLLAERGAAMAGTSGGSSGLLMVDYKGKQLMPVYRVDPGLVSLLSEVRAHEQQAATELEQWKIRTVVEATVAVTPAAVALSQFFTSTQLEELERKILDAQAKSEATV